MNIKTEMFDVCVGKYNATHFVTVARAKENPRSGAAATAAIGAASGFGETWGGARQRAAPGARTVGGRRINGNGAGTCGRHHLLNTRLNGFMRKI